MNEHADHANPREHPRAPGQKMSAAILGKVARRIVAAIFALVGHEKKSATPGRVILPLSSGSIILPNTSVQVTARPQNVAFRPERIVIGGTPADWIVNDIKIGNRSQFSQSGDIPGELFAATAVDSFVSFETVQVAMDFSILLTYVGKEQGGTSFVCAALGTAVI
jgi:hypothetical protein